MILIINIMFQPISVVMEALAWVQIIDGQTSGRDKLLSYLSAQAMQAGGPEFDIPLDRQQLADYLAVDRSAMSTALGKLRDEGVLTFQKNHFHLLQQMEQTD